MGRTLFEIMEHISEWGYGLEKSRAVFRQLLRAAYEGRIKIKGFVSAIENNESAVPSGLFDRLPFLDWHSSDEELATTLFSDFRDVLFLHPLDTIHHVKPVPDEGDHIIRGQKIIWRRLSVEAAEAEPLLAELRCPVLPSSLSLLEACRWITTRDTLEVGFVRTLISEFAQADVGASHEIASACRNGALHATGKLFGRRENIDPIAFDDNGFRFDGGGCLAPNGVSDDLLAPLLVMEHSGRVVIGGTAWKERPVWLDVRFPRDGLIRLWPARVGVEASVVSEKSFFQHQSAAGKASGKRRKDARQWTAHALELAIDIRSEEPTWGKERVAGEIQLRWKLPTPPAPGITTLKTFIGDCEKAGELPIRNASQ